MYRLCFIRSIQLIVMCGAMAWCCLRSGQSGRSHSHSLQTVKLWDKSIQDTTSPLPLDAQEPSTNSWSTAGKIEINFICPIHWVYIEFFLLRNLAHYKRPSFVKINNYLSINSANDLLLQSTEDSDENSSLISRRKISIQNNYVDVQWSILGCSVLIKIKILALIMKDLWG